MARAKKGLPSNPLLANTSKRIDEQEDQEAYVVNRPTHVDNPEYSGVDVPTSRFTFYFTQEQLDRLDEVWTTLRRRTRGTGQRVSKSQFVRVALDRLLDDFDADPGGVTALLLGEEKEQ
jgi:hypothetical protein